jgi:peptide/nickel transport system permease protein
MIVYTIKRVLAAIPILFGLVTVVFLITRLLPGDPALLFISPTVPASVAVQLRKQFGLDQPLFSQYLHWLFGLAQGKFGYSFTHQRAVLYVIEDAFKNTAILSSTAIVLEIIIGIFVGVLAAQFRGSLLERLISAASLTVYTMPAFWVAALLLLFFSQLLGVLPSSHMHSVGAEYLSPFDYWWDSVKHIIMPSLTLALPGAAGLARFVHTQVVTTMKQQYIVTAKSFGLSKSKILLKHALPNALLPVITIVGLELGGLLSGALVTETIFAWPGIGRIAVTAVFARDYPLIVGCTVVCGIVVIAGNLIADLLYAFADPRIKVSE